MNIVSVTFMDAPVSFEGILNLTREDTRTMTKTDVYKDKQRCRIAVKTLIFTLFIIALNGILKIQYAIWETPVVEATVLICLPLIFFFTYAILKGAYFVTKDNHLSHFLSYMIISFLFAILNTVRVLRAASEKTFEVISGGQMTHDASYFIWAAFFVYLIVLILVKKLREHKVQQVQIDSIR